MNDYDTVWDIYREAVTDAPEGDTPDYWVYFYHEEQNGEKVDVDPDTGDEQTLVLDGKGYVPVAASELIEAKDKVESVPGVIEATGADLYKNGPKKEVLEEM